MAISIRGISTAASGSATFSVARPSGTSEGTVLVAFQSCDNGSPSNLQTPTGGATWQQLQSAGGTEIPSRVWWKVAGASEPTSYTFRQESGSDAVVAIVALSGASTTTPLSAVRLGGSEPWVDTPSLTPSSPGALELRWAAGSAIDSNSWTVPSGFIERADLQSDEFVTAALATRTLNAAVPSGVHTFEGSAPFFIRSLGITVVVHAEPTGGGGSGGGEGEAPPPTIPAIPSTEQVVHYTYVFADLRTDDLIAKDLDLHSVSYDRRINEAGQFSAEVYVTDEVTADKVARIVPRHPEDLSTGPGRTVVHVYRNGVIWGSYIIWSASVSRQGKGEPIAVRIEGASLESYLDQVKIRDDYEYTSTDQIEIARDLISGMQSTGRYDIGLTLQSGTSGVSRDRTYLASENATYGERLRELANVDDGFEWCIQTIDNGDGTRSRVWTWGYPKLGSTSNHKFMEPGNVLSWSEDIDGLRGATAWQTTGRADSDDGSEVAEAPRSDVALAQAHLDAGWPGIDKTVDYSSVSDPATLDDYAKWWAANRAGAVRVHQATVRLPANTSFGPGNLGDQVTIMLVNPWWPIVNGVASFAKTWRVVGMSFKPPEKGSGQEECTLTFEEGPDA